MRIPLGTIVRDKVTGLVGVAENCATFLHGVDRYCVQPRVDKDGKIPESVMVDDPQLETVEGEARVMMAIIPSAVLVNLGDFVEDPIRGRSGTVCGIAVYLNGCRRVWIQPKQSGDRDIDTWWIDEAQAIVKKKVKKVADKPARTGGPAPANSKF